jgi:hypothetical protein
MGTPLDPKVDHRIKLAEAVEHTKRHRGGGTHRTTDSGAFNAKAVQALLAQPGCVGMRFYHGRSERGESNLVLVGVDAKGNNMVNGMLLEGHFPCPPYCADEDVLQG